MILSSLMNIIVPIVILGLTYVALNSSNIPEEERTKAYIVMIIFTVLVVLSKVLSKVFKYASAVLVTGGIILLIYFLYSYNAIPFMDKGTIDDQRIELGI